MEKFKISLFHSTGYGIIKKPLKIKKILTVHDLTPLLFPSFFSKKHKIIFKKILKSGKYADIIICVSESTKDDLLKFFPEYEKKIKVVHNFISERFCKTINDSSSKDIPKEYFLFVGGSDFVKNIKTILKAIKIVKIPLVITGLFSDEDKKKILNNNQPIRNLIHFTGFLDNKKLMKVYKNSIALLYPSLNEGFGYPPLEALKCDTVSIVSKRGSLPEVLKDKALYIDNPLNYEELAEKMKLIMENSLIKENILRGKEELLSSFSQEKFKENIVAVYKSLEVL